MLGLYSPLSLNPVRRDSSLYNKITTILSRFFAQDLIEGLSKLLPLFLCTRLAFCSFQEAASCLNELNLQSQRPLTESSLDALCLPYPPESCVSENRAHSVTTP